MVSQRKAEAVRNSVAKAFGERDEQYGPKIVRDWDRKGDVMIMWEEGPFEWTHTYVQLAAGFGAVDPEFGFQRKPVKPIKGVFVEPYTSYALGLYDE